MRLRDPEIRRLVAEAKSGNLESRNRVVLANLGLAHNAAHRWIKTPQGQRFEYEDLVGWGQLGLFDAIERFDLRRAALFGTYATWRVDWAIRKVIAHRNCVRMRTMTSQNLGWAEDPRLKDPSELASCGELGSAVARQMRKLNPRSRRVASEHIAGTFDAKELAKEFGVSTKRIYQVLHESMRALRGALRQFNPIRDSLSA